MEGKISIFSHNLIWFGAGVSIAEILAGTCLAPLGFTDGLLAIVIGHVIGGLLMYYAGIIGAQTKKCAMDTVKISFGKYGGKFFSCLNILQLVGWTAIMIYDGALAANSIYHTKLFVYALIIGGLILAWIVIGISNLGKVNTVAMTALMFLSLILCKAIFTGDISKLGTLSEGLSFGAAVELSIAMPLSWLPLISDYTKDVEKPVLSTASGVLVYNIVSSFMYIIGMGAALMTGEYGISEIFLQAGLGIGGLIIIVFSTVTTTFLDAYSAGVSAKSVFPELSDKKTAAVVTVLGIVAASVFPMDDITGFLYLIGSVFAPMIALQIVDYFILKTKSKEEDTIDWQNMVLWLLGFFFYRKMMTVDIPIGSTIPCMAIVGVAKVVLEVATRKIKGTEAEINS